MYKLSCSVEVAKEQAHSKRIKDSVLSENDTLINTQDSFIHNYQTDQQKCLKILNALLESGIDVNAKCN
jgi:hypothetical protein